MNRFVLFIFSLFFLLSCSSLRDGRYEIQKDEFKNQSNISLIQYLTPSEKKTGIGRLKITYQRQLDVNEASLKLYVSVSRIESSFPIDKNAFVKANDKTFELVLDSQWSEYKTAYSTKSNTTKSDSTTTTITETNSEQYYNDKFVINLNFHIVESILQSNKLVFRFYSGPEMLTYELNSYQLNRLKGLLRK
jgi:hypothetical protein